MVIGFSIAKYAIYILDSQSGQGLNMVRKENCRQAFVPDWTKHFNSFFTWVQAP